MRKGKLLPGMKRIIDERTYVLLYLTLFIMETGPFICRAIQWTGFYTIETSVMKELKVQYTFFFYKKNFYKKEPQKPQNLKKLLREFPASIVWAAIFKNPNFSYSYLKVTKLSEF